MNKKDYIKKFLEEGIETGKKFIQEREGINEELESLPNDCKGLEINDFICENPNYKFDAMSENNHSIGYMAGLIETSKKILMLNDLSDSEFEEFLEEQERVRIHNEKVMADMKEYIKTQNPDLLNEDGGIG